MASPSATDVKVRPPATAVGMLRTFWCDPSPTAPYGLLPQQNASPIMVTPQVWKRPTPSARYTRPPSTAPGTIVQLLASPLPSCPDVPFPQQRMAPSVVLPQVCTYPAPMRSNIAFDVTRTGTWLMACDPLPSWPEALSPQHQALPSVATPQV